VNATFAVADMPRTVPSGLSADVPLVTLAWRALQAEHQRRRGAERAAETDSRQMALALADFAEHVYRLQRSVRVGAAAEGDVARLERILADLRIEIVAPEGAQYTSDLMERIDNIAQVGGAGSEGPHIAEIVAPAIVVRGELVRMGKAIIAV
jgi:hypothetical protein